MGKHGKKSSDKYSVIPNFYLDDERNIKQDIAVAELVAGYPGITAEDTETILLALDILDRVRAARVGRVVVPIEPPTNHPAGPLPAS